MYMTSGFSCCVELAYEESCCTCDFLLTPLMRRTTPDVQVAVISPVVAIINSDIELGCDKQK